MNADIYMSGPYKVAGDRLDLVSVQIYSMGFALVIVIINIY